jgi:hypothetical protein
MKLRSGFVSNSSSCSFCIAKCYMTEQQVEQFRSVLKDPDSDSYFRYCTIENENYFLGSYEDHGHEIINLIGVIGLKNYIMNWE